MLLDLGIFLWEMCKQKDGDRTKICFGYCLDCDNEWIAGYAMWYGGWTDIAICYVYHTIFMSTIAQHGDIAKFYNYSR